MSEQIKANSTITEFFTWITQNLEPSSRLGIAARSYLEQEARETAAAHEGPFLTIITRTQGNRPEMLAEVLLGLSAQSDTDFELLIMGHNISEEGARSVSTLLSELPDGMRARTRLIPVMGGTRTTPLSRGFEEARGAYITILDDDDLIFENWVECFHKGAEAHAGKILHTYAVLQDWETLSGDYSNTSRAIGPMRNPYCRPFRFHEQLSLNYCPLCTLAFPAELYHGLGLRFDETLTTTEDWDFLMRSAFLVGVADIPEITFLYRNWVNAENSHTLHGQEEWKDNYNRIRDRLATMPALLSASTVADLIDAEPVPLSMRDGNEASGQAIPELEVFFDCGHGFNEQDKRNGQPGHESKYPFVITGVGHAPITALRIDPALFGGITIGNLRVKVLTLDGKALRFSLRNMQTNGIVVNKHIVFVKDDPQLCFTLGAPTMIDKICIGYDFQNSIDDEVVRLLSSRFPLFYRVRRKLKHLLKRILRRV